MFADAYGRRMLALGIEAHLKRFAAHITHASVGAGKAETGFDADQIGVGDVTHGMLPVARG
jgi:hypothetical protein